jgi:hypothetical protein
VFYRKESNYKNIFNLITDKYHYERRKIWKTTNNPLKPIRWSKKWFLIKLNE